MRFPLLLTTILSLSLALPFSFTDARAATVEELERRLDLMSAELQKIKNESAVAEPEYSSSYGLGPSASKIYKLTRGLSIGGYGEGHFTNLVSDKNGKGDDVDLLRFILYAGYKFTDRIVLNAEVEFEHAKTGEGSEGEVAVEFVTLDFLMREEANARIGLMLMPIGLTNELHEPTLYHGNDRPQVERDIIPSTWREMGAGLFGSLPGNVDYKFYLVNGLDAADFSSTGIRSGRQNGSKAKADDWAMVARLDWSPLLGFKVGGSAYLGDSGQNQTFAGKKPDVFTEVYEVHGTYRAHGLELKALASMVKIDDAEILSAAKGKEIAEEATGWYVEGAYDILPLIIPGTTQYLAPFVRYESLEYDQARAAGVSAGDSKDYDVIATGLSYKPIPNIVLKADYRNFDADEGVKADEVNLGFGYIF